MSQRGIANWEIRPNSSPNAEQLPELAQLLHISVEELVCGDAEKIKHKPGPKGRLLKLFHEASKLPKDKQKNIAYVLEMYVESKKGKSTKKATSKEEK